MTRSPVFLGVLAAALASAPVVAADDLFSVSEEQMERCKKEGGCGLISHEEYIGLQKRAFDKGVADCKLRSGSHL